MKNTFILAFLAIAITATSCKKEESTPPDSVLNYTLRKTDYTKTFTVGRRIVLTELTGGFVPFNMAPTSVLFNADLSNGTFGTETKIFRSKSPSAFPGSLFCLEDSISTGDPNNPNIIPQSYSESRYYTDGGQDKIYEDKRVISPYSISIQGSTDNISFPSQSTTGFGGDRMSPSLPAGIGSLVSSSGNEITLNFFLNSPSNGFNNAPCEMNIKSLEELAQYYDYGTIKLPGYASPMRVAIVKRVQEHEKYYSNNQGTLLPQNVLSRFGLTQNQNVKQVFYDVFNVGGLGLIARFYEVNGVKQPVRVFVLKK